MFEKINTLNDLRSKKSFKEKAEIYIKLTNAFSRKKNIPVNKKDDAVTELTNSKLMELGILSDYHDEDHLLIEKILKKELYLDFVLAINYSISNKNIVGTLYDKIDNKKRNQIQILSERKNNPKIVDLFCGAGGLSLGFVQEGFQVALANDNERVCIETYKYNHPEVPNDKIIKGDVSNIIDQIKDTIKEEIDVIVGGPPCQGFSTANQQRIIDDPRNKLYKYFVKAIELVSPKFFIMENVRGMLHYAEQVVEDFKNVSFNKSINGYSVGYKILVSNEFGVAQKRPRLFFIGIKNDISMKHNIDPADIFNDIYMNNLKNEEYLLKDALGYIKKLDAPRIKNITDIDDDITGGKIAINNFVGNENKYLEIINDGRKIDYVYNHKARYVNDINFEIYKILNQGEDGTNDKIKHIMPYKHRNHIFKDKYFKLVQNKPSRTITAHLRMDCHSHIHPNQIRSITPREAARIQSFPDDYFFLGAYLKTYMQIGNAVPPLMARGIARTIKRML